MSEKELNSSEKSPSEPLKTVEKAVEPGSQLVLGEVVVITEDNTHPESVES